MPLISAIMERGRGGGGGTGGIYFTTLSISGKTEQTGNSVWTSKLDEVPVWLSERRAMPFGT